MMSKQLLTFAALLVAMGVGLIITGVTSPSTAKVCQQNGIRSGVFPSRNFPPLPFPPIAPPPHTMQWPQFARQAENEEPRTTCLEYGLFFVGVKMIKEYVYFSTPLEQQEQKIRVIAGLILIGGVGSLLALLFFTIAACNVNGKDVDVIFATYKRNMIATILLAGSASLHITGFAMYTHHNIYSIGNSTAFVGKVVSAITGFNSDVTSRFLTEQRRFTSPSYDVTINSTISTREYNAPINMDTFNDTIEANNTQEGSTDINFFENADIYDTWFPYESPHDVIAVLPFPVSVNPSSGSRRKRGIRKVLKLLLLPMLNMRDSVPTFGYSFYLCWFGCACHAVALVCGIVYWRNNGSKCKLQRSVV